MLRGMPSFSPAPTTSSTVAAFQQRNAQAQASLSRAKARKSVAKAGLQKIHLELARLPLKKLPKETLATQKSSLTTQVAVKEAEVKAADLVVKEAEKVVDEVKKQADIAKVSIVAPDTAQALPPPVKQPDVEVKSVDDVKSLKETLQYPHTTIGLGWWLAGAAVGALVLRKLLK